MASFFEILILVFIIELYGNLSDCAPAGSGSPQIPSKNVCTVKYPSLRLHHLPTVKKTLLTPSLQHIQTAFDAGFKEDFVESQVNIIDCPDLTKPPYSLTMKRLGGKSAVLSIGKNEYLFHGKCEKIYDLRTVPEVTKFKEECFIFGASSGPYPYVGGLSEDIIDTKVDLYHMIAGTSRVAKLDSKEQPVLELLSPTEHRVAFLADIFACEGRPSKIIQIHCSGRRSDNSILDLLRSYLAKSFPEPVGIGCIIRSLKGKLKEHIQPPYFPEDINGTTEEINAKWLKYFEFSTPQIGFGVIISKSPGIDGVRLSHVHSYGEKEGGHFYGDVTKDQIEYEILCSPPVERIYKID